MNRRQLLKIVPLAAFAVIAHRFTFVSVGVLHCGTCGSRLKGEPEEIEKALQNHPEFRKCDVRCSTCFFNEGVAAAEQQGVSLEQGVLFKLHNPNGYLVGDSI